MKRKTIIRSAVWAQVFGTAGVLHFVKPEVFDDLVPEELPGSRRDWTIGSGVVELGLAGLIGGLTIAATTGKNASRQRSAQRTLNQVVGPATALFLLGVWPGNIKMAWDYRNKPALAKAIALARVPAQIPMMRSVARLGLDRSHGDVRVHD
ncbi:DoxX family protein [Corynebacterium auriscanis]|uniref:DoxX family protein n=1 Tax=Corynebacterium auriscanis TaxID=99807 RepID=UPI003CE7DB23